MLDTLLHLALKEREKGITIVLHQTAPDTTEGSSEGLLLDAILGSGVTNGGLNLFERTDCDFSQMVSEVLALEVLDHLEHVECSSVEVLLDVKLLVGEVVDECPLLDVVVLGIDADVLHLLLGVSEMSELLLLSDVGPHAAELLGLVASVDVVEDTELGANEVGEVADFDVPEVEGDEVLVMEDHAANPLVVRPPSEARDRVDGSDVEEDEQQTSSAAGQALVMGRHLLWAHGFEQGLHVVEVREHQWVLVTVVGVNVSLLHVLKMLLIVSLSIFGSVLRHGTKQKIMSFISFLKSTE